MYFAIPGSNLRVLGAMHIVPADAYQLPRFVSKGYAWADRIVSEHDDSELGTLMTADVRKPLSELISPDAWRTLISRWPAGSMPALDHCHPWAACFFGAMFHFDRRPGVEANYKKRAAQDSKRWGFFELLTDFVSPMAALSEATLCAGIEWAMANIPQGRKDFQAMHVAWAASDSAAMGKLLETFRPRSPAIHDVMFSQRNRAWSPKFHQLASATEKTLLVVGAGHLCGPGNLFECAGIKPELVKML